MMFEDTIVYDAQRQVGNSELETVIRNKFKHSRYNYYASSDYLQVLKKI